MVEYSALAELTRSEVKGDLRQLSYMARAEEAFFFLALVRFDLMSAVTLIWK